jgi:hypothetical protein
MRSVVVRYRPRPDAAEDNRRLVERVFAELADTRPDGLRYATWQLSDGTFVHVAEIEGDVNPLEANSAFGEFSSGVADRCEAGFGPDPQQAQIVGSYRFNL